MPDPVITVIQNTPSGEALAHTMGVSSNESPVDIAIRYGYFSPGDYKIEINNAEALRAIANKYEANNILKAEGINVPKQSTNINDLDRTKPIFARKFRHSKGTDIIVLLGGRINRRPRDFFTQYISNVVTEYRCHVIGDKVVSSSKKEIEEGREINFPRIAGWVRNENTGYVNKLCECPNEIKDVAIRAVKALNLDFGAVDLAFVDGEYGENSSEIYVFEVNTAPGLIDRRLEIYGRKLKELALKKWETYNNTLVADQNCEEAELLRIEATQRRIREEEVRLRIVEEEIRREEVRLREEEARLNRIEARLIKSRILSMIPRIDVHLGDDTINSLSEVMAKHNITFEEWSSIYDEIVTLSNIPIPVGRRNCG